MGLRRILAAAVVLGTATSGLIALAPPAAATVFEVSITADEIDLDTTAGDLSLREAIGLVNAAPGNHLIELQAGETYTLSLNCGGDEDLNAGGDLDLTAGASAALTLKADGLTTATIQVAPGCTGERVLDIHGGSPVILQNVVLTGGNLPAAGADQNGADGGAIRTNGDLTLEDTHLVDNHAGDAGTPVTQDTVGGRGGAVFISGDLTAIDSVISGNRAGDGADSTTFGRRSAGGAGGAIYMATTSSAVTLITTTVHSNRAGDGGPGLAAGSGGDGGAGGSVYSVGPVTVSGGRVGGLDGTTQNRSGHGGSATFSAGSAGEGGGIAVASSGVVTAFNGAQFTFNRAGDGGAATAGGGGAGGSGGAIAGRGPVTLSGVTLSDNTAGGGGQSSVGGSGGPGGDGGGVVLVSTNGTFIGLTAGRNTAGAGGGSSSAPGGHGGDGGAIHVDGGTVTLTDSLVGYNDAGAGGTSSVGAGGNGGGGGAVSGDRRATVEPVISVEASTVIGNESGAPAPGGAAGNGGAILQRYGTLSLRRALIRDNATTSGATGGHGGGLALDLAVLAAVNSTIAGNTATGSGGGYSTNGTSYLRFVTVDDNTAATDAAIATDGAGTIAATVIGSGAAACSEPLGFDSFGWNVQLGGSSCGLAGPHDQSNVATSALGALADNGGATWTMLPANPGPLFGAIPAVDCAGLTDPATTVDQRNLARPVGQCEIGAVEVAATIVPPDVDTEADGGSTTVDPIGGTGGSGTTPSPGSVTIVTPPLHGTAVVDPATGVITYTPDVGFTGVDQFVYMVCAANDSTICGTATVTVNVVSPILDSSSTTTTRPVPIGASRFVALSPARLFDTRTPGTPVTGFVPAGGQIDVDVTGVAGVPETGAAGIVMNVTATEAGGAGFVTVWPTGRDMPVASSLNLVEAGQTAPNLVTVPVGPDGRVSFFTQSGAHLLADVAGYYTSSGASASGRFVSVGPARVFDTREPGPATGRLGENGQLRVQIAGQAGLPATGISAVALNVTIADGAGPGFVTVWPGGTDRPLASNLNVSRAGENVPNLVVVPLGADGTIELFTQSGGHLLADVTGYFTDATAPVSSRGLFVPITPHRVFDTRSGDPVGADGTIQVPTVGVAGLPSSGVGAVSLNVTATESRAPGFVTAYPSVTDRPTASLLNLNRVNETRPNATLISVGSDGQLAYFSQSGTHLLADVTGYFVN